MCCLHVILATVCVQCVRGADTGERNIFKPIVEGKFTLEQFTVNEPNEPNADAKQNNK